MVAATPPTAANLKKSVRDVGIGGTSASGSRMVDSSFLDLYDSFVKRQNRSDRTAATEPQRLRRAMPISRTHLLDSTACLSRVRAHNRPLPKSPRLASIGSICPITRIKNVFQVSPKFRQPAYRVRAEWRPQYPWPSSGRTLPRNMRYTKTK